jgi:hypothetical protein
MKKFFFIAFSLITISSFSQAMDCNCNYGIKAGANFASITNASGLSNRTGFLVGIFGGVKLSDMVIIQGDLLYSQQGAEFDSEKIDLSYINIPIVIKYFVVGGLNIQAGPQFGFIVDDNINEVFEDIVEPETETFDFTGVVGLGYDFPMKIKVEARYNFGLTDIFTNADGKNSVASLTLGYSFL